MKRKTHRKLHKSKNIMMRLASVLFVLVLASTCMLAGMLARYTVTSSAKDSARTAVFSVSAVNNTENSETLMDLGVTEPLAVYALTLGNQSEVAVTYDVEVDLKEKLPKGIEVYLADDKDGTLQVNVIAVQRNQIVGEKYQFEKAGQMEPTSEVEKYLIFKPVSQTDTSQTSIYDNLGEEEKYEEEIEFTVDIKFVQID